jgi:hypothetical protein
MDTPSSPSSLSPLLSLLLSPFFVALHLLSSSLAPLLFYPPSLYSFEFRLSSNRLLPSPFEPVKEKMLRLLAGINKVAAEYRFG